MVGWVPLRAWTGVEYFYDGEFPVSRVKDAPEHETPTIHHH
jgi:hypothetical protein